MERAGKVGGKMCENADDCGQDPATVTADEMDALDVRLKCRSCQVDGALDAYNWRGAVDISYIYRLSVDC